MVGFGPRRVGDGNPCFITFEAGPTHNGLESAMELASLAAAARADAIKFQMVDPGRLVSDRKQTISFKILVDKATNKTETVEESLFEILCRRALTKDQWRKLKKHCDGLGLAFFATVGFEEEIELLEDLGCDSIKIASADVNHIPLIRRAARSGMCLQLDTGNATIGEIETTVDVIRAEGNENIIIHHCPSGYPAHLDGINLRCITTLKQMFPYPIAYSDHTPGWEMDLAAVALGANLVEKTISKDRTTPQIEHMMSIEPNEMATFIQVIRDLEKALGRTRRVMKPAEAERRIANRRSIHLVRDVKAGTKLTLKHFEYRRPGYGIPPSEADFVAGQTLCRAKRKGDRLEWADLAAVELV
jgi:N,N'-diacetyllegionaminate synthase